MIYFYKQTNRKLKKEIKEETVLKDSTEFQRVKGDDDRNIEMCFWCIKFYAISHRNTITIKQTKIYFL